MGFQEESSVTPGPLAALMIKAERGVQVGLAARPGTSPGMGRAKPKELKRPGTAPSRELLGLVQAGPPEEQRHLGVRAERSVPVRQRPRTGGALRSTERAWRDSLEDLHV